MKRIFQTPDSAFPLALSLVLLALVAFEATQLPGKVPVHQDPCGRRIARRRQREPPPGPGDRGGEELLRRPASDPLGLELIHPPEPEQEANGDHLNMVRMVSVHDEVESVF